MQRIKKFLQNLNQRGLILGIGAIVLILAVAAVLLAMSSPKPTGETVGVRRGAISATVDATGKVRPKKSARLSLPVSGVVANVNKLEGDEVLAGDVIISLRADEANRRVKQAELQVQNRQLDLARAKAAPRDEDIDIARANLQKATAAAAVTEANYASAATAQNDAARQLARADLDIVRAQFNRIVNGPTNEELEALQNAVTGAQLELEAAKAAATQTRLTAPYNGTVTEVTVREGELVGGFNPLASISDLKVLEIATEIDEIDVAHAEVGQLVEVRLDAFPADEFEGKLTRLFPAASTQRGSTVYGAIVEFSPGAANVRSGMGARMKIRTVHKDDVLLVPNRALKSAGTRKSVQILVQGQLRDVIVETGVTNGSETEVVSGLKEGDTLLIQ